MEDVAALCSRVIVIDGGKVGFDGGIDALRRRVRPHRRVRATLPDGIVTVPATSDVLQRHGARADEDGRLVIDVAPADVGVVITALLAIDGIRDLEVGDAPLEDVMREMFERGADGRAARSAAVAATEQGT